MYTLKSARLWIILAATASIASPAFAQSRRNERFAYANDRVPPGHRPPAGMCRVWIDGVPPGHQPPVTNCATAYATRPANGRVIYGSGSNAFPGRGNGKWKNAQRSSGTIDPQRIYGTIFTPSGRQTIRRNDDPYGYGVGNRRGEDDDRFENRRGDEDDDRFEHRRGDDDDDRFEDRRQRDDSRRFELGRNQNRKMKFKNKHKDKHERD